MRTLINAVLGLVDLALEVPNNSKETKNYLKMIRDSEKYSLQLVNDLLDISKIEIGNLTLNYSTVNILTFVDELLDIIKILVNNKEIDIKVKNKRVIEKIGWVKLE